MAGYESWKVIVWERLNKTGKWCPYSAEVSQLLEQSFRKNLNSVCLGDADSQLKVYTVNLSDMVQISESTGTKCNIRRKLCDDLTALGQGFTWQWHGDGDEWHSYDIDVNNFIESAYLQGKKSVNLSKTFSKYHYEIDLIKMLQINKRTKRKRSVRRNQNVSPYPVERNVSDFSERKQEESIPMQTNDMLFSNLAEEVPGTSALELQVNQYIRNVQTPIGNSVAQCEDSISQARFPPTSNSKRAKPTDFTESEVDKMNSKFTIESCKPSKNSTVALVNGKPWTDSWPPHTPESLLKPVPGIEPLPEFKKPRGRKKKQVTMNGTINIMEKYTEEVKGISDIDDKDCIICCDHLSRVSPYNDDATVVKLSLCSHLFHKACIEAMKNSSSEDMFIQCPTCKKIHGEKCGIQPPGSMLYHVLPYSLPGFSSNETIRIIYDIRSGTQGPEHPNPGKKYTARGFPRHCYLPDNEMGRKILRLLVKAWQRRLIFTIGRSSTTGEENTVTWNEIHHKTEFGCNRRGHGYPDPNYFENIIAELEAHGVVDDEVYEWQPA